MTHESFTSYSTVELKDRRRKLRRQRGFKSLKAGWRLLAVGGLAGGLAWIVTLPDWVIRRPEQVAIEGNQILSAESIRALLPLSYPQSLLRVHPDAISRQLETGPIADASVRRQLFPPSLTVRVRERYPVALVVAPKPQANSSKQPAKSRSRTSAPLGMLDEQGFWMTFESYEAFASPSVLPKLKVSGDLDLIRRHWVQLYSSLKKSPLKISEVDWQDATNLILKTELGPVHFGLYSDRFGEQLQVLDRMRQLPKEIDLSRVAYIDLKNPKAPLVQLKSPRPSTPAK
jgi:cell division protein FtsQ